MRERKKRIREQRDLPLGNHQDIYSDICRKFRFYEGSEKRKFFSRFVFSFLWRGPQGLHEFGKPGDILLKTKDSKLREAMLEFVGRVMVLER